MSPVTCHLSRVTCHVKKKKIILEKIGQSGGAGRWRVCYQRGLPRLVYRTVVTSSHQWMKSLDPIKRLGRIKQD